MDFALDALALCRTRFVKFNDRSSAKLVEAARRAGCLDRAVEVLAESLRYVTMPSWLHGPLFVLWCLCVSVRMCVLPCCHMCSRCPSPGTGCSRSPSRSRSWLRTAPPMATQSWLASAWMPPWVLAWSCTHAQSRSSRRHSSRPVTLMAHWRCSSTQGEWLSCCCCSVPPLWLCVGVCVCVSVYFAHCTV